jgi:hypothetical protein
MSQLEQHVLKAVHAGLETVPGLCDILFRRGHYELGLDVPPALRVAAAFNELAKAI